MLLCTLFSWQKREKCLIHIYSSSVGSLFFECTVLGFGFLPYSMIISYTSLKTSAPLHITQGLHNYDVLNTTSVRYVLKHNYTYKGTCSWRRKWQLEKKRSWCYNQVIILLIPCMVCPCLQKSIHWRIMGRGLTRSSHTLGNLLYNTSMAHIHLQSSLITNLCWRSDW